MRSLIFSFLTVSFVLFASLSANADIFSWKDPESKLTVTFPDTWSVVQNHVAGDVLTIVAPAPDEDARCTIRWDDDRRFLIYPGRYEKYIQQIDFSNEFWVTYLEKRYQDISYLSVKDGGSFGRGFSSIMETEYLSDDGAGTSLRHAIGFVSHYYDKSYVLECSTLAGAFEFWRDQFQSIAGSIDFDKLYNETINGHYRNFTNDYNVRDDLYVQPPSK